MAITVALILGIAGLIFLWLRLFEPLAQGVQASRLELRSLTERLATVEKNQHDVGGNLQALGMGLTEGLTELRTQSKSRQDLETDMAQSIRRLEAVLAGTQTKGAAGENILEVFFGKLPPEWQVRNFKVGNKVVEFGLRLPNRLILPIDSKWPATPLTDQLLNTATPEECQRIKTQIESTVLNKVKEVKKYIDPDMTVNFALAVVPDSVYELCFGIQPEAFKMNVVLVSYSLFIPYLLLVFQTMLKTAPADMEKFSGYIQAIQVGVSAVQEELEGRFSKALIMLENAQDTLRQHMGLMTRGLASLLAVSGHSPELNIPDDSNGKLIRIREVREAAG